jgi:hypothetical protein
MAANSLQPPSGRARVGRFGTREQRTRRTVSRETGFRSAQRQSGPWHCSGTLAAYHGIAGRFPPILYGRRRSCQEFGRSAALEFAGSGGRALSVRTQRPS